MSTTEIMELADLYYHNPYRDGSHTHLVYADQKRAALLKAVEALEVKNQILQNDLNTALRMLAGWCVAVDVNGTGWDDWDEYYKDAMYRDGPLRGMLDEAIAVERSMT